MTDEALSIDELDARSVALKREIEGLRDERRRLKAIRDRKVSLFHLGQRLGIDVEGLSKEDADKLLAIAGVAPNTISVTPETATIELHGHAAGVSA